MSSSCHRVLISDVFERESSEVKEMIHTSSKEMGFPKVRRVVLPDTLVVPSFENHKANSEKITRKEEYNEYSENAAAITRMTDEEREAAIQEVYSVLSTKSISFLKERGRKAAAVDCIEAEQMHLSLDTMHDASKIYKFKDEEVHSQNEKCYSDRTHSQMESTGFETNVSGSFASDFYELTRLQQQLPEHVREAISWTLPEEPEPSMSPNRIKSSESGSVISSFFRSQSDRFDLLGRLVVFAPYSQLESAITSLLKESVLATMGVSSQQLQNLARDMIQAGLECGLLAEPGDTGAQPQDELRHHQSDNGLRGYTMDELCELSRSEVPAQRALGLRALHGLLWTREAVVSLEPYGLDQNSETMYAGSPSGTVVSVELLSRMTRAYGQLVQSAMNSLPASVQASSEHITKLCKAVVSSLLTMCASDFPVGIPVILALGPDANPSRRMNRLLHVRCLHAYLFSDTEERQATRLWLSCWGCFGCPSFLTPHLERESVSYESYVEKCRDKFKKSHEDEVTDQTEQDATTKSPQEEFALHCRWGRVDAMMQVNNGSLINLMKVLVFDALSALTDLEAVCILLARAAHVDGDGRFHSGLNLQDQSVYASALSSGVCALEVLCSTVRVGSEETRSLVCSLVIEKADARRLMSVVERAVVCITSQTTVGKLVSRLRSLWWKLLAEAARGSRLLALSLCEMGVLDAAFLLIVQAMNSPEASAISASPWKDGGPAPGTLSPTYQECDETVWQLRLWRVSLKYGLGRAVELFMELWMASQLRHSAHSADSINEATSANSLGGCFGARIDESQWEDVKVSELMWLCEHTAALCSERLKLASVQFSRNEVSSSLTLPAVLLDLDVVTDVSRVLLIVARGVTDFLVSESTKSDRAVGDRLVEAAACHFVTTSLGVPLPPSISQAPRIMVALYDASTIQRDGLCEMAMAYCSACLGWTPRGEGMCQLIQADEIHQMQERQVTATLLASLVKETAKSIVSARVCLESLLLPTISSTFGFCSADSIPYLRNKTDEWTRNELILASSQLLLALTAQELCMFPDNHLLTRFSQCIAAMKCSNLSMQSAGTVWKGTVANGLFDWQSCRLYSAQRLCCLAFESISLSFRLESSFGLDLPPQGSSVFQELLLSATTVLSCITPGFSSKASTLLLSSIDLLLSGCSAPDNDSASAFSVRAHHLASIFIGLRKEPYLECCNIVLDGRSSSDSLLSWVQQGRVAVLSPYWLFRCCALLRGADLRLWLVSLADAVRHSPALLLCGGRSAIPSLCILLKIVCEEYADSWYDVDVRDRRLDPAGDIMTRVPFLEHASGHRSQKLRSLSDSSEEAYEFIISLCIQSFSRINPSETDAEFCRVAEDFAGSLKDSELNSSCEERRHSVPLSRSNGRGPRGVAAALRLASSVLDSSLAPNLSHRLHAASLLPFLHTSMPVLVRERVWRELSDLRLIHLADSPALTSCLASFLEHGETSRVVASVLADALLRIRQESDRASLLCRFMLYNLCYFIFRSPSKIFADSDEASSTRKRSPGYRLLLELLSPSTPDVIIIDIFHCAVLLDSVRDILQSPSPSLSEKCEAISGLWSAIPHSSVSPALPSRRMLAEVFLCDRDMEMVLELIRSEKPHLLIIE